MPNANEDILGMIRKQLGRSNPPGTEALYGRAARIDESIRQLDLRQFNAKYVLRVRREMKNKGSKERKAMGDGRLSDEQREQVMTLVEQAVDEDPDVGSKALQEKIQEEVPAVADLSVQQFHARYPLQVKRRRAREREEEEEAAPAKPEPKTPEPGDEARARIRDVILGFGREVAAADREELVGVFENLDNYVDEILEVAEQ